MMENFRNSLILVALASLLALSCNTRPQGQLIGVQDRPTWRGINPFGMVYVPSGTLHIGASDQDVRMTMIQQQRSISIQGFYMDDTEITNNEYRQFVYWVRDSIAHTLIGNFVEDDWGDERLDWSIPIDWDDEMLDDLYYPPHERIFGKKELDPRKLVFEYKWYDWQRAAHDRDRSNRANYIMREETEIYPDENVWIRDFTYAFNEPMTRQYFTHPAYDDYPVVGVSWKMASAFCYWRTMLWKQYEDRNGILTDEFRLPTEHEWEYAARGGNSLAPYPWGGYYLRNTKGCLLANFKPGRGNYPEDGGMYTVRADAYFPNDYGLYNMAGNVSEWTQTAFHENAYSFQHDLNPTITYNAKEDDPEAWKRKVVRGGSWKDVGYFLQTGTRHWEYQDTTKSHIGFRCALTFLGRARTDFN